ncbi:MAG: hypothetical protein WDM89_20905 [Rhizomicrobium sp.]
MLMIVSMSVVPVCWYIARIADREQHQHRTQQRVEEEFIARIDTPLATPNPDDDKHRDQAAFEEQIKQEQVQRREHAHHERFEREEGNHVFRDAIFDRFPARENAERHQDAGQHDEQHRNAVHAHVVGDATGQPRRMLHELKCGGAAVEVCPKNHRQNEIGEREDQRDPAGVARQALACTAAREEKDNDCADKRQERDDAQEMAHGVPPANRK